MPLRALCKKARIYESVIRDIDPVQQHVTLEGTPEKIGVRIHYDYLVIALGSKTNFLGLKNVEKYSFTMKTLADAISLRNRLIDMLEQAENEKNSKIKKRLLTFVVVGGGFAGVETAGEINDFLHEAVSYYHNIERDDVRVTLIEAGTTILPGFNENCWFWWLGGLSGLLGVDRTLPCSMRQRLIISMYLSSSSCFLSSVSHDPSLI